MTKWTKEHDDFLRQYYSKETKEFILSKLTDFTWKAIQHRVGILGLTQERVILKWTNTDVDYLKKNYENTPRSEILLKLDPRNWATIRKKAVSLKLQRNPELIKKENLEYTKKAVQEKYGVDSTFQLDFVKDKIKQNHLTNLGVEYPSQSAEVIQKRKENNLRKYNVISPSLLPEVKNKVVQTNLEKFGVENPNMLPEFREKAKQTNLEKYGAENTYASPIIQEKIKKINLERYGTENPQQNKEIQQKTFQTNIEKYGVAHPAQNLDIQNKIEATNLNKFGVKTPFQNEDIKDQIKKTNLEKYGFDNPAKNELVKQKIQETNIRIYGVPWTLQSEEIRFKAFETMLRNNSFSKSKIEDIFYEYLKTILDPEIKHQIKHPILGYIIDYYSPRLDLWIQLDGTYWHGKDKTLEEIMSNPQYNPVNSRLKGVAKNMQNDQKQDTFIKNLIRFWDDDLNEAIAKDSVKEFIWDKLTEYFTPKYEQDYCWQHDINLVNHRQNLLEAGLTQEEVDFLKVSDFEFKYISQDNTQICKQIVEFIKKHEWLKKMPNRPTHRFIATYKNIIAGVVILAIPNEPSNFLGEENKNLEKLISRGASISWSPKNLASSLIMYSINWMVQNTEFRCFTAYSDIEANEIGTIYQACNFNYLGQNFGADKLYLDLNNLNKGWVTSRSFSKKDFIKKLAKELNISWDFIWEENYTILWEKMPLEIVQLLKNAQEKYKRSCLQRTPPSKHKYCLIKGIDNRETEKLLKIFNERNKTYPYPKRSDKL